MAVTNFVPDIWSARILQNLSRAAVSGGIVNRNYEGDVRRMGDSVKITNFVDPTIGTYTSHVDITVEDIDDATQSLLINQAKYFAFELDDVEKAQSVNGAAVLATATDRASYGLRNTLDTFVLSTAASGGTAFGAADIAISTATAAYDHIVDLRVQLDKNDVPQEGRWVVITPDFYGKILKDSRFIAAGDEAGAAVRANGFVGVAAGMRVHVSNNLPAGAGGTDTTNKVTLAGYTDAITLAEQIVSVEAARMEKRFADMVKGLHVYGAKVTRATGVLVSDTVVS